MSTSTPGSPSVTLQKSSYPYVVVAYIVLALILLGLCVFGLFRWEPRLGYLGLVVAVSLVVWFIGGSFRKNLQNTMLVVYEQSTLDKVFVSGTFLRSAKAATAETAQKLSVVGLRAARAFGLPDVLFRPRGFYPIQRLPLSLLQVHLDTIPIVTKKGDGSVETGCLLDTTLLLRLSPRLEGLAEFVSGFSLKRFGYDLTESTPMGYLVFDDREKKLQEVSTEVPCIAKYLKKELEQMISDVVRTVAGDFLFGDIARNVENLPLRLTEALLATELFQQVGFDDAAANLCELKVEKMVIDPTNPLWTARQASIDADAESERGRGKRAYLNEVSKGGVSATQALASDTARNIPNLSLISGSQGLLDAAAAQLLGAK